MLRISKTVTLMIYLYNKPCFLFFIVISLMYVDFAMCVRKLRIYPGYVHKTAEYKTKKSVMSPALVTFPYISVHCAVKW